MKALLHTETSLNPEFNLEEGRLTQLCQAQDSSAQEVLYNRYVNKMLRTCLRYMQNEYDAEDMMVGAFVKVFKNIEKFEFRGSGSLEGWIKRIMINECLMALRKKKKEKVGLDTVANQLRSTEDTNGKLNAEEIYKAVLTLPNGYRTVFNMYAIEGYSHKEIAEKLGISENTSKSQLSKARASLTKKITKLGLI